MKNTFDWSVDAMAINVEKIGNDVVVDDATRKREREKKIYMYIRERIGEKSTTTK